MEDIPYKSESHPPMTYRSPYIQEGTAAGGRRVNEKWKMKWKLKVENWKTLLLKALVNEKLKMKSEVVNWNITVH